MSPVEGSAPENCASYPFLQERSLTAHLVKPGLRVCYRSWSPRRVAWSKGEILRKNTTNSSRAAAGEWARPTAKAADRKYVPLEDDLNVRARESENTNNGTRGETAKTSMKEVFGPGGLLEKCMKGGFDRRSEEHTSELQSLTNLVCRLL